MRGMKASIILLLAALCAVVQLRTAHRGLTGISERTHTSPDFCNGLDCPDYEVRDDVGNGIVVRRYWPSTWATTDVNDWSYEKATTVGFQRLFGYISGHNELEEKIEMTAPVVTTIRLDKHGDFHDDYTVSFFLPFKYQQNDDSGSGSGESGKGKGSHRDWEPPKPRDDRVEVVDFGTVEFYVLPFDSYALGFRVRRLALDLFDYLDRKGISDYQSDMVWVAVYDPPFKVIGRHNELWVMKRGKGSDDGSSSSSSSSSPKTAEA